MNSNLKSEIERSIQKILNQRQQVEQVSRKLDNLQKQLDSLQSGIEKEEKRLILLGQKQQRRDGLAESTEEQMRKQNYNVQLRLEKLEMIRKLLIEKNIYDRVEQILPNVYRDSNLN